MKEPYSPRQLRKELFKSNYQTQKFQTHCDQYCLAHGTFFIDYEILRLCKCGLKETIMKSDKDAYIMTIYAQEILDQLDSERQITSTVIEKNSQENQTIRSKDKNQDDSVSTLKTAQNISHSKSMAMSDLERSDLKDEDNLPLQQQNEIQIERESDHSLYTRFMDQLFQTIKKKLDEYKEGCIDYLCGIRDQKTYHVLKNTPKVFTFNMAWQGSQEDQNLGQSCETLLNMYMLLPNTFDPFVIFKKRLSQRTLQYFFKGFVVFYGQHYYAYFRNLDDENWYVFDDHRVMKIGSWYQVVHTCIKGRAQPTILFYERLENDEEKHLAETLHFMNSLISDDKFKELREYAQSIDHDIKIINQAQELDPEILEQMKLFEQMEKDEALAFDLMNQVKQINEKTSKITNLNNRQGKSSVNKREKSGGRKSLLMSRSSTQRLSKFDSSQKKLKEAQKEKSQNHFVSVFDDSLRLISTAQNNHETTPGYVHEYLQSQQTDKSESEIDFKFRCGYLCNNIISLYDKKCMQCDKPNKYYEPKLGSLLTEKEWYCQHCTLINKMPAYNCRGCKKTNAQIKLMIESLKSNEDIKRFWQCNFCKTSNDNRRKVCNSCFSTKPINESKEKLYQTNIQKVIKQSIKKKLKETTQFTMICTNCQQEYSDVNTMSGICQNCFSCNIEKKIIS
eukprot:403360477